MKRRHMLLVCGLLFTPLVLTSCNYHPITDLYKDVVITLDYNDQAGYLSYSKENSSLGVNPKLNLNDYIIIEAYAKENYKLENIYFDNQEVFNGSRVKIVKIENTLKATFSQLPIGKDANINFDYDSNLGSVKTLNGDGNVINNYKIGDFIVINATPIDGYKVKTITFNNETVINKSKVQIQQEVNTLKVVFEEIKEENGVETINEIKTTYLDLEYSMGISSLPSIGSPKLLVIPVEFSDYTKFSENQLNSIKASFIGNKQDNTNDYWESLKSYYYRSSYGKLDLDITIADVFKPSMEGAQFKSLEGTNVNGGADGSYRLLDEIYSKATINNTLINYTNFDNNRDGFVDGVWLVYNANNYNEVYGNQDFWAYCYNDYRTQAQANVNKPVFSKFANASQIFLYESSTLGHDAHTLIHETGHMLGLDDYYSYDNVKNSGTGGLDMMDYNIGEHNAFSKFSLGWVNPKVVTNEATVTFSPYATSGECLILSTSSLNNAFNEYFMIEYYTPEGLFSLDATTNYANIRPRFSSEPGIRISHIDARLIDGNSRISSNNIDFNKPQVNLTNSSIRLVGASNTASFVDKGIYGTDTYNLNKGKYSLVEVVTPSNIRTYNSREFNENFNGLFKVGDQFNKTKQANFFINGNTHDGKSFNFTLTVDSITKEEATLTITRGN